ncbi:hypothetical protein KY314_03020 [Candidatus Woesearchaeota archaeon]|nr:hypothetical protein [Candidatus Woesearchaeota archaeon]
MDNEVFEYKDKEQIKDSQRILGKENAILAQLFFKYQYGYRKLNSAINEGLNNEYMERNFLTICNEYISSIKNSEHCKGNTGKGHDSIKIIKNEIKTLIDRLPDDHIKKYSSEFNEVFLKQPVKN